MTVESGGIVEGLWWNCDNFKENLNDELLMHGLAYTANKL